MIKKFKTIYSLAVFQDFDWDLHMKEITGNQPFQEINIIYGQNYSGKTTLSRIVRALETGIIPPKYESPQFEVEFNDGATVNAANLQGHGKIIRVFNEDFVRENLNFFNNPEDKIKSFAVLGDENIKIEKEIYAIEKKLGSNEEGKESGLYAQLKVSQIRQNEATNIYNKANDDLEKKKIDKATGKVNGIKYRPNIFGDQNYNIAKLENEIQKVLAKAYNPIDDNKRQELEQSLNETVKSVIPIIEKPCFDFQNFCDQTKEAVTKKIGISDKIPELARDYVLNEWVKKGHELHKGKRETCAFCNSSISSERWHILEKHFDEETEKLETSINNLKEKISAHKVNVKNGFNISKNWFYVKYHNYIDKLIEEYNSVAQKYNDQMDALLKQLDQRTKEITKEFDFEVPVDVSGGFEDLFKKYSQVHKEANEYTNELGKTKSATQDILRLYEVHKFVEDIGCVDAVKNIENLKQGMDEALKNTNDIKENIDSVLQLIDAKKRQLNDEEKGAVKVNEYLNNFFGHKFLSLQAHPDETKTIYFQIIRDGKPAFNLSEGECSLIAFCYFMAKLNDVETNARKPIIWIDDPISSLDGNHVFFVYSLLKDGIVTNKSFEQLFISTHNLDFLKYLKRLDAKDGKGHNFQKSYYMIQRKDKIATIDPMPKYLKNYITEFNHLFHQIYKCAKTESIDDTNYAIFYNFGNNARKFMEIFMAYKYPDADNDADATSEKIKKFFGNDITFEVINRLNNEYSHMAGVFERGGIPVDVPEIKKVAKRIIDKIKEADKDQFDALLRSINEQEKGG
ncbi:MAG: AAA family ATPase [Bacteroidales bacterium]|jgi:wobble nucleotide-excising tRNase|nr:AAA family ATPase [Bacteroidales bacterium]